MLIAHCAYLSAHLFPQPLMKPVNKRFIIALYRSLSNKSRDAKLEDALKLFSPKENYKKNAEYKPSILTSVAYGPPQERYQKSSYRFPKTKTTNQFNSLVDILDIVAVSPKESLHFNDKLLNATDKEFRQIVNNITDQNKLIEITKFLYTLGKLTCGRLTTILLNKNLISLHLLPFDVNSPENANLKWDSTDFIKIKVILLKKYYSLHKPLNIIRNLNENFEPIYFLAIKNKDIPRLYQRTIWKFYFEYLKDDESKYLYNLKDVYHTFTIWESSTVNSKYVSDLALGLHRDLNDIQKILFQICSHESINDLIASQIKQTNYSEILSLLKKICIQFEFHSFSDLTDLTTESRATYYMVIESLEKLIFTKLEPALEDVSEFKTKLKKIKRDITKFSTDEADYKAWDDKFWNYLSI